MALLTLLSSILISPSNSRCWSTGLSSLFKLKADKLPIPAVIADILGYEPDAPMQRYRFVLFHANTKFIPESHMPSQRDTHNGTLLQYSVQKLTTPVHAQIISTTEGVGRSLFFCISHATNLAGRIQTYIFIWIGVRNFPSLFNFWSI